MFNKLKDMGSLAKKAKEMRDQMKDVQKELKTLTIENDEQGIKIVMTGEIEITSLVISEANLANREELEKKLKKIINKTAQQAKNLASEKLSVISKGLNIPGL